MGHANEQGPSARIPDVLVVLDVGLDALLPPAVHAAAPWISINNGNC